MGGIKIKGEITSRERVLKSLNHEKPDEIPIDLGATVNSSIVKEGYDKLRKHLGLQDSTTEFIDMMMRSVFVEDDVKDYFQVDVRGVFPQRSKPIKWLDDNRFKDQWGLIWKQKKYYYELTNSPLGGNISIKDINNYSWPDTKGIVNSDKLRTKVQMLKANYDSALILGMPSFFVHVSQYLRGFEDWYLDCARDTKLIETLFDRILEVNMDIGEKILMEIGDEVDIIKVADDLGTQQGLQISPQFFRKSIKPRFKKYIDMIKKYSPDKKIFIHSCGNIESILTDFIEIGIDIINPVQVSAKHMSPDYLKEKYGDKLCFWGGIDTQHILRKEKPESVKKEVERIIQILGEGGGFVLGAVHNIQPDIPPENIEAMFTHAKAFSRNNK